MRQFEVQSGLTIIGVALSEIPTRTARQLATSGWLGGDWGSVPAWVGSVLTGTSLMIAALSYRRSVAERTREQWDRERRQAAKVSTWVVNSRRALIQNGNDMAITIQAFVDNATLLAASDRVSFAPGATRQVALPYEYERMVQESGHIGPAPSLLILDSSGREWVRTETGELDSIDDEERRRLSERLQTTAIRLSLDRPD
jgi:hypothetical protein